MTYPGAPKHAAASFVIFQRPTAHPTLNIPANLPMPNTTSVTLRTLSVQTASPSDFSTLDAQPSTPCVLDFIASDATLDRCDEIIDPAGWQLDNYRRNPVFQNSHQYGDILFTLGKALITEVRNGKLFQRIQFATDINPMARIAYGLYQAKYLNAVSVGFTPIRWQDFPESSSSLAAPKSDAVESSNPRRKYLEQELLEVSAVGIPANPNALQLGLKSGAVKREDLRDLADLLKLTTSAHHATATDPIRSLTTAQLLTFAKQIHAALRC
jgi:hypothetical protein